MTTSKDIEQQGRDAALSGLSRDTNPHRSIIDRINWNHGYDHGAASFRRADSTNIDDMEMEIGDFDH